MASPVPKFLYIVPPRLPATVEPSRDWHCRCRGWRGVPLGLQPNETKIVEPKNMPRPQTGKRRSKRTKSVVPVSIRIAGSADSHLAHTLDVSNHGVKLGGCRGEIKVGDRIEIQYHHKQAQFRVAWIIAHEGSSEKQIGAECLEPGKQVWGAPLPQQMDEYADKE